MKRDMDLIRHLLLQIEEKDNGSGRWIEIDPKSWNDAQITDHLFQLDEHGLIEGNDTSHIGSRDYKVRRLTASGHDYLDAIRDPEIWRRTKEGAKSAGGLTFDLVGELAKGLIRTQIKKHTGIEL